MVFHPINGMSFARCLAAAYGVIMCGRSWPTVGVRGTTQSRLKQFVLRKANLKVNEFCIGTVYRYI